MASKSQKTKKKAPRAPKVNILAHLPRPKAAKGPYYYLKHAREYPFLGCWVNSEWKERGMGPVVVARKQDVDKVIFGVFLIDLYCLGVKDAFYNADFPLKRFRKELARLCSSSPQSCSVEFAHELIYGSLEYAKNYGFNPHEDYRLASQVLDPPDTHPRTHNIEFGKNGKPFYVSGPYDNPRQILARLERTAGKDNYHYLVGFDE